MYNLAFKIKRNVEKSQVEEGTNVADILFIK